MKLITAIIRPEKLDELVDAIMQHKGHGLTVTEVRGFGRQYGHYGRPHADPDLGLAGTTRVTLLPKVRLEVLVLDENADAMMEAIAKHARTETIGDGKIWVTPVNGAMRIRTGERDSDAV